MFADPIHALGVITKLAYCHTSHALADGSSSLLNRVITGDRDPKKLLTNTVVPRGRALVATVTEAAEGAI